MSALLGRSSSCRFASPVLVVLIAGSAPSPVHADRTAVTVAASEGGTAETTYKDGLQELLSWEAERALADRDYRRAHTMYARLLSIDPDDARALRELGRSAAALGAFDEAERALARCWELRQGAPDPELHFLRGEALLALGRRDEGLAELELARVELAVAPASRQRSLWLARIHALRGQADEAISIYRDLLGAGAGDAGYREVAFLLVEAHLLAGQTASARSVLDSLLARGGGQRANDMLAWVLELRGEIGDEVVLREVLSDRWDGAAAASVIGYARSLERANRPAEALQQYREARHRGNRAVGGDITRLEARLGPEVLAAGEVHEDPTGAIGTLEAGAMIPLGDRSRLVTTALHQRLVDADTSVWAWTAWWLARLGRAGEAGLGATAWQDAGARQRGGAVLVVHSDPGRSVRASLRGGYGLPWQESAATLRERGSTSGAQLDLHASPWSPRLVLVASGRLRRLELGEVEAEPARAADQAFAAIGADWVAAADFGRALRGHVLDRELLRPAHFSSSLVVSYRHSEVAATGGLGPRIFLIDRSRTDEVSATLRRIVDGAGVLAAGASGGLGYDWLREARLWRVGGELVLAASPWLRLTASTELAHEATTGLIGRRWSAYVGAHADL